MPGHGDLLRERLCIHQVTLMESCDFRQSVECFARHGIEMTAVWRAKLEEAGPGAARAILDGSGVRAISLCAGGLLTEPGDEAARAAIDANRRWLDAAAAIGCASMVTITGGMPEGSLDLEGARGRARDRLADLLPHARASGVRLALEPLHPAVCGYRSVISTLGEANDWLDEIGAGDELGIALDTYAIWWEPGLSREIARAGRRIINFHCADWLRETKDVRLDRGMPGDGLIDNRSILGDAERAGFSGAIELEIFSANDWWRRDPDEVVRIARERMLQCFSP